jgi:hypothetical protein
VAAGAIAALLAASLIACNATRGAGVARSADAPAGPPRSEREVAYDRLLTKVDPFRVEGGVRTEEGWLLPESIRIEVRSEICVESREPGSRFWSLDWDTCFVYVSVDTLDARGEYDVAVPSLDADRSYEASHSFGDIRLVQRGPVTFLAESSAGWRHQETFTSSRNQRRDLVLSLDTDTFWVVEDAADFRSRPHAAATLLGRFRFGDGIEVVRFHQGWAECVMEEKIGWMEMRCLGTEEEMKVKAPFKGTPQLKKRSDSD